MRLVVQRVTDASVSVGGETVGQIGLGLMVLVGVTQEDTSEDAAYLAEKLVNLRIFEDEGEKMNLSLLDVGGSVLSVSQFTLYGDTKKGDGRILQKRQSPIRRFNCTRSGTACFAQKGSLSKREDLAK